MSWVRRVSSWLLALFLLLLLLSLLAVYLAPGIALWWTDRWYQSQGEGYQVAAADWHFSPFKGELSLQQLALRHPGHVLGDETVLNQLLLRYELSSLWQQHVHIRELSLNGVKAELRLSDEQLQLAGLVIPIATGASDNTPAETQEPSTNVSPWRISVDRWQLNQHQLGWHSQLPANNQGQLTMSLSGQDVQWPLQGPLSHSLRLQLHTFELDQQLSAQFELNVDGQLSADLSHWQGQLQLEKLALNSPLAPPLTLQGLQLQDISWQQMSQTLALAQITLTDLQLGTEQQPLLSLPTYQVADVELTPEQLSSGWHEFKGLEVWLDIDKNGQIKALAQANNDYSDPLELTTESTTKTVAETTDKSTNAVAEQAESPAQSADDSSNSLKLFVAGVRQGDKPSVIHLQDASVAPAFKTDIKLQSLQVSPISVQQQQLTQALDLQLKLTLDDYNQVDIKGELGSYQAEQAIYPQGDVAVSVSQLNLVPLNGYLSRAMGYHASRGQLNVDANLGFKQGTLQGDVALLLRNARFEPEDEAVIDRVSKQIAMPVDTALSLLRDDSGNIRLSVPLSGDLSDPDVGLNDLGQQLASLALRTATMHYLKQSLVPYGTLLSIADFAGSQLMAIRLDALVLDGEQQMLNATQQQQLDKVIGIMQDKPELELKVCPQFAKENAPENWSELATLRAQWVKQYLAGSKDKEQQPLSARVTLCKPELADQHQIVLGF